MFDKNVTRARKLNMLMIFLEEVAQLAPGSKFFHFMRDITKSPATNMFWVVKGNFAFMFTVDNFWNGEAMEPGFSLSYGHVDHDRGSFHLLRTAGHMKFDYQKALAAANKYDQEEIDHYGKDDLEAIGTIAEAMLSYQEQFEASTVQ